MPEGRAAENYAQLIYRRATDGMLINDWSVDWASAPWTYALYPTSPAYMMRLPGGESAVLADSLEPTPSALADALHAALGIVAQRLTINLNDGHGVYSRADSVKWGRTTASGGGRYCCDIYLVESGPDADSEHAEELPAGIYHYSILHHAWEKIASGDHTDAVAAAQAHERTAQRYLLTTINYWRSGFKYNDFAYQATAMDVGTLAGCMIEILGPGLSGSWDMWIAETPLAGLLGLNPGEDGIYAVQAWGRTRPRQQAPAPPRSWPQRVTGPSAPKTTFLTTDALQRDMKVTPERPDEFALPSAVATVDTTGRSADWLQSLLTRESSFGRFDGTEIPAADLLAMLGRADEVGAQVASGSAVQWEFLLYVSAVKGLTAGLYRYRDGELSTVSEQPQSEFLSSTYFLRNYDGHRASATVVLCANVFEATRWWGVRGYRYVNAVVGAMCQAISVDAVRHGLTTGTALGFNTLEHAEHAGLEADQMSPMLMMMAGIDDEKSGRFRASTTTLNTAMEELV